MGGSLRWSIVWLTFENQNTVLHPYVAKNAILLFGLHLQVNTAKIQLVNKNVDSILVLEYKISHGVLGELSPISIPGSWKVEIEMRILTQCDPPVVCITRKIPEDLRRHRLSREDLCSPRENEDRP